MGKLPAFMFYTGDWLKDPTLSRCSPAARGIWIDMLCLMFECEERGVLSSGSRPWSDPEIAAAVRGDTQEVLSCLRELLDKGVAHRNESGAVYSRRLVRDEETRKKGNVRQQKFRNGGVTPVSHRSSYSSSTSKQIPPNPPSGGTESHFVWCRETVAVQMGRRKRLPSLDNFHGARAGEVAEFLTRKGFPARVVSVQ